MDLNVDDFKAWMQKKIEDKKEEICALERLLTSNDSLSILILYKQYEEEGMPPTSSFSRLDSESESESIQSGPIPVKEGQIGGTDAVRNLFLHDPTRRWTPREVQYELEKMLAEGSLYTQRDHIQPDFVHSILSGLVKQDFLTKHQPVPKSRRSWYVKKESSEKDLAGESGEPLEGGESPPAASPSTLNPGGP